MVYREFFPVEFAVALGQDTRIQNAEVMIERRNFMNTGKRGSVNCAMSLGRLSFEEFRMNQGQQITANILSGDCKFIANLLESGKLKLHIDLVARSLGPILGSLSWGRSPLYEQKGELNHWGAQLPVAGTARFGIELWNRVLVEALGNLRGAGLRASVGAATYGARVAVDLPKNFFLEASFSREHVRYRSESREISPDEFEDGKVVRRKNTAFGLGFGIKRDLIQGLEK